MSKPTLIEADNNPISHSAMGGRSTGILLAVASIASVVLMAHHPTVGAHSAEAIVTEMAQKALLNEAVHGALLAILFLMLFGLIELSIRLGLHRPTVRAGLVGYSIGTVAMMAAILISGFVIPNLASRYTNASHDDLESLRNLLVLCTVGNRTLASFSTVAMSLGVFAWSLALLRSVRATKVVGVVGMLVAAGTIFALLVGRTELDVRGMTTAVVAQTLWVVVLAIQLVRGGIEQYANR